MNSLDPYLAYGEPWRISEPIVASMDKVLVTPKDFLAGPVNIGSEPSVVRGYGIVLMGWAIHFYSAVAADATIVARSPHIIQGNTVDDPIMVYAIGGAGVVTNSVQCCIPLTSGGYRHESSPTSASGASLVLQATGTSAGMFTAWGIHTSQDFGRYGITSSPALFNA